MKPFPFAWKFLCLAAGFTLALPALAQESPQSQRADVKEWINVQKILSREKADWSVEQAVLSDMVRLLEREKSDLGERIEAGRAAVTTADETRRTLETRRGALREATATLETSLPQIEASIRTLHARFPAPLQQTVAPLFNRLREPASSERLSLSERLQAVVGILSQADKFNSVITEISENRTVGNQSVIVRTLYFGLAGAIYSDPTGDSAGILVPATGGWESIEKPADAPAILTAMDVYANLKEAAFVGIPVQIR